jgi:hypothetical protein
VIRHPIQRQFFLLDVMQWTKDSYFVDAFGVLGAGTIDHLFHNRTKYLLIHKTDKMKKMSNGLC